MKQITKQHRKQTEEQPEVEAKDVKDEQLAKETEDLLAEVDCCLAEAAVDLDEKAKARAEWDKLDADFLASDKMRDARDERWYGRQAWLEKYRDVVTVTIDCCGVITPHFE